MAAIRLLAGGTALAGALLIGHLAWADVIDGEWCSVDNKQHMVIAGPTILTPGDHRILGDYARHAFSYVVPDGEANAGQTVFMRLVNPETVNSRTAPNVEAAGAATPLVWHHCRQPISAIPISVSNT